MGASLTLCSVGATSQVRASARMTHTILAPPPEFGGSTMHSNSRTLFVSVVGTVSMVVATVLLAAWSPPAYPAPVPAAQSAPLLNDH